MICNELAGNQVGIVTLPLTSPGTRAPLDTATPLIDTPFEEVGAQISPDGRTSRISRTNPDGRGVRPAFSQREWRALAGSLDGGSNPMWARSGAELFYLDGATAMTALPVRTSSETFSAGNPKTLFDARIYTADGTRAYDVSPDGTHFLLIKESRTGDSPFTPAGILVFFNWLDDLKQVLSGR